MLKTVIPHELARTQRGKVNELLRAVQQWKSASTVLSRPCAAAGPGLPNEELHIWLEPKKFGLMVVTKTVGFKLSQPVVTTMSTMRAVILQSSVRRTTMQLVRGELSEPEMMSRAVLDDNTENTHGRGNDQHIQPTQLQSTPYGFIALNSNCGKSQNTARSVALAFQQNTAIREAKKLMTLSTT